MLFWKKFSKKTLTEFNFENLENNGLIYLHDYIPKMNEATNDDDAMMSFYFYQENQSKTYKGAKNIILKNENMDFKKVMKSIKNRTSNVTKEEQNDEALFLIKYFLENKFFVTDLSNIIDCPQYFLYTKMFEEKPIDIAEMGLHYSDMGIIYHDVFNRLLKECYNKFGFNIYKQDISQYKKIIEAAIENLILESKINDYCDDFEIASIKQELNIKINIFIEKELQRAEDENYLYIPSYFEEPFYDYSIYNHNGINIKLSGRIDRIDLHYSDSSYKKIDGIRIIDYKRKIYNPLSTKKMEEERLQHSQLMFYLDYLTNDNKIKFGRDNISIAYIGYDNLNNKNEDYYSACDDTEILMNCLDELKSDFTPIFDKISKGIIDYNPSKEVCDKCPKNSQCPKAISTSID